MFLNDLGISTSEVNTDPYFGNVRQIINDVSLTKTLKHFIYSTLPTKFKIYQIKMFLKII